MFLESKNSSRIFLLCALMMLSILFMQHQLTLTEFLFSMGWRGWPDGKCFLTNSMNSLLILILDNLQNGGLYHVIFLLRFLFFLFFPPRSLSTFTLSSYDNSSEWPLEIRASLYLCLWLLNIFSLDELLLILLEIDLGICLIICLGWLDNVFT